MTQDELEGVSEVVASLRWLHYCYKCHAKWYSRRSNTGACHKCGGWVVQTTQTTETLAKELGAE